jgi:hypothetical protein
LLLAKGKYVAILEGDDKYTPDHLQRAYEVLSSNKSIGVYAGSNQLKNRNGGLFNPEEYTKKLVTLKSTPAPSELVFIRRSPTGQPYLFNVKDYRYCPEIELLLDIAQDGFNVYYSPKKTIMRGMNHSRKEKDVWRYYRDHFVFLERNADKISKEQRDKTIELLSWRMLRQCLLKRIRS